MRIALCGGTFDPFHRGHLEPVLAVRAQLGWDRIVYVPAHRQPFKRGAESASGYHRFAMAVLATEDVEGVGVSSWELERAGVSFTVDTLEHLRAAHPDASLEWIIGDDNLARLGEWKSLERLFELANFVVLSRGGGTVPEAQSGRLAPVEARPAHGAIVMAPNLAIPISATDIRQRVREGLAIDAFVDPRVSRYIQHNRLYITPTKGAS